MERLPANISHSGWLRLAGGFVMAVAVLTMVGWVTGHEILVQWFPGAPGMVMNTALCLLLCGAGVFGLAGGRRGVAAACGLVVALLATTVMMQFVLGRSLGVDELFWKHQWGATPKTPAGQMAPNATAAFALLGVGLVMLAWRRTGRWLLLALGGVIAAFALVPVLSFLTGRFEGDSVSSYRGMALPTSVGLLVLGIALFERARAEAANVSVVQSLMTTALGMLIAIGVMTVQRNSELITANELVVHTYSVRGGIDHFVAEVARMESSMRAYGLTGEKYFRDRAEVHRDQFLRELAIVHGMVADNPVQTERVTRLRGLADEKFAQNAELARLREEKGAAAASDYLVALMARPGQLQSALVILADDVRAEENRLLNEREDDRRAVVENTRTVQVLGSLLALGLLGAAANAARRAAAARERAEQEVRVSRERFLKIFGAVAEGIVFQNAKGQIEECNASAERILGLTRDQLMGLTSFDPRWQACYEDGTPCPPEQHPMVVTLRTGEPIRGVVMEVNQADGRQVWVSVNTEPLRAPDGTVLAVVASFADITMNKQAAAVLRESEERFRTLADAAFEGIVISESGRVVDANDFALALLKASRAELIGTAVLDFVAPASREAVAVAVRDGREAVYEFELRRKDGVIFLAEARARMMHVGQRRLRMTALRDVTARRQLESDLRTARDEAITASRLKSEFLATVSHEIRTPMNGIIGMVDVLMETPLDDDQRQMARVVRESGHGLLDIICDILDFSKIEAGKLRIDSTEFDLRGLIEETLGLLAPRAEARQLELRCELPPELAGIFVGDVGRIRQVFTNLVGNAIKFTERGHVIVRAQLVPRGAERAIVRVAVEDTGIGIPPEAHGRLFQPFTQVDGSPTRRFGGTGLGLAISRQLMTLMGGEVSFTSEPGRGSTFWFELPLGRVTTPPLDAPESASQDRRKVSIKSGATAGVVPPARRLRLLVVEDNAAGQIIARTMLERMGHTVDIAANGQDALGKIGAQRFDAVLMDCQMPVLDGYEVTRRIRAGAVPGADPRVPIIAFTAYAMADDRRKCLAAGMDDYVSKPVSTADLRAAFGRCGLDSGAAGQAGAPELEPEVLSARVEESVRALPGRTGPSL